jgi:Uma2 family endonuclease
MVATDSEAIERPPPEDQFVVMHDVPWSHYEVMLAIRGDAPRPRIAYLNGELELMSPSKEHELITSMLDRLVQVAAEVLDVDLWPVRSWTVRRAPTERGVEPDACFTLGDPRGRDAPDLAIEVAWTRGGIDKLEIYRGLNVPEVWFWRSDELAVHVLEDGQYTSAPASGILPGLSLALVAKLVHEHPRAATRRLRAALGDR